MLSRRTAAKFLGATALAGICGSGLMSRAEGQTRVSPQVRGAYLIRDGAVITVDPILGTLPRANVLVRDGRIEGIGPGLDASGADVIDATDMIVMPGFV